MVHNVTNDLFSVIHEYHCRGLKFYMTRECTRAGEIEMTRQAPSISINSKSGWIFNDVYLMSKKIVNVFAIMNTTVRSGIFTLKMTSDALGTLLNRFRGKF